MASLSNPHPRLLPPHSHPNPISPLILSFPFRRTPSFTPPLHSLKTKSDGSDVLRKPLAPEKDISGISDKVEEEEEEDVEVKSEEWVDWEDQILQDTVPLVGFVRMILHSGKYENGDRLSEEHERTIVEKLLPYHPESDKKIGPGIDHIMVGFHPEFETSRCLFIARKDGQMVDFSYWKCIKGLIRKNYPLYADSFILRHFRRRRRNG